jgi:glycosyltransferase involved in cell wall biosynthesis
MDTISSRKLNVCMLLPVTYKTDTLVYPSINILSYIVQFGHQVTWIISSEAHTLPGHFELNGVDVFAIPFRNYFPGKTILARIFNKLIHNWQKMRIALAVFCQGKYNLIFARDDVFYGLTALYIKWKHRVPFIFELANPLEMEWEVYKLLKAKPICLYYLIAKFNELITIYLLHHADLILPISSWLKDDFVKNKGIAASKIMPLPEGVDVTVFAKAEGMRIKAAYPLNGLKVIIYVGTLAVGRNMKILIQAFHKVRMKRKYVKLLVVGDGGDLEILRQLADELGIMGDVIFTGRVPQSEVANYIAAADIGVSPIPPLSFFKLSSPIKLVEYMALAKPVVANQEILDHDNVLHKSQGGLLVPYTAGAFADAILTILDDPGVARQMGQRGREWVEKNRNYEPMARQVEKAYLELLNKAESS